MGDHQILYQDQDEYGPIFIADTGTQRILAFAGGDEQSRCLKSAPHVPQLEYIQAMLLVLLFLQPKRALLLGLGGGSLMTALHHLLPSVRITAVELRERVIELAYQYFQLPRGKRLNVIHQNATDFLGGDHPHRYDVIFADLYQSEGVDPAQLQSRFIGHCVRRLKDDGWLVLNGWSEHRENAAFIQTLKEHFVDLRAVLTGSHNWVILAGRTSDTQSQNALKARAFRLSTSLGFPLTRHLARLRSLTTPTQPW